MGTIGALPVTVARACGHDVAYLPGLSMRRITDLYPGQAKTDARDAFIIADTASTMPHTLRRVDTGDEILAELGVLVGFDDDLAGEATRISNRIRGLLTGIHTALERVVGPRIGHPAVLEILTRCSGPNGIRKAGKRTLTNLAVKHAPRMGARLADEIIAALSTQTVTVPGSKAAEFAAPKLAESLKETLLQRKTIGDDVERMLDEHPLSPVEDLDARHRDLRLQPTILLEVGDGSAFKSSGHLAAYAGIEPVTHRSGSSIRGEHPARSGNSKLKRALFLSAFAALHDSTSRSYYDHKRAEGKKHNAALICLARRRCDVLHAMLKNKTRYQPSSAAVA